MYLHTVVWSMQCSDMGWRILLIETYLPNYTWDLSVKLTIFVCFYNRCLFNVAYVHSLLLSCQFCGPWLTFAFNGNIKHFHCHLTKEELNILYCFTFASSFLRAYLRTYVVTLSGVGCHSLLPNYSTLILQKFALISAECHPD